jgi:hypothetical protein
VALTGSLLLLLVLSTALGGITLMAGIERKASASHAQAMQLRLAATGAVLLAGEELRSRDLNEVLGGTGSLHWRRRLTPPLDLAGMTRSLQRATLSESSHEADTPVWRLFAHMPWREVAGTGPSVQTVAWVADDWQEADADPGRDRNGLVLVRAGAFAGTAAVWVEALCERDSAGVVRVRHLRSW